MISWARCPCLKVGAANFGWSAIAHASSSGAIASRKQNFRSGSRIMGYRNKKVCAVMNVKTRGMRSSGDRCLRAPKRSACRVKHDHLGDIAKRVSSGTGPLSPLDVFSNLYSAERPDFMKVRAAHY